MASTQATTAIVPTRNQDYPEWYQAVIRAAELADNSPVRGCMVIRPWGYAIWENIRARLDQMFKETGHVNAYFPLFIPLSFFQKEAEHVEGFAKECAVVTHHRLELGPDGKLRPSGELEEPLVVRPTSETIIGAMFARWIESWRDLPIKINQWANVVRWEMRTRMFLRTTEFLWQEGHTAHETREEAWEETLTMLQVYRRFAEEDLAIPVIPGEKTPGERFPGAENTFSIEAMMQDRKALQAGTSHFLGQNFARASGIQYTARDRSRQYAWTTSWGVSTRLIGALIMTHGDDDGLALPPRIAPAHVAILPIIRSEAERARILEWCERLAADLRSQMYEGRRVEVVVDVSDENAGERNWRWVKRGIPVRAEVGPRDIAAQSVFVGRRDRAPRDRYSQSRGEFVAGIADLLAEIQRGLYERARKFRQEHTHSIGTWDEFRSFFTPANPEKPEIHGGFAWSHWCGSRACEQKVNEELSVTIRCRPIGFGESEPGRCVVCGAPAQERVIFAKAY